MMLNTLRFLPAAFTAIICLGVGMPAQAINNNSPLRLSVFNGWKAFEIVTTGSDISAIRDVGYDSNVATLGNYDGLGATLIGRNSLRVYVNHELTPAAISRVELALPSFQQSIASIIDNGATSFPATYVTAMGYGYSAIYAGNYHAILNPNPVASGTAGVAAYGSANFSRFCSGTFYTAQAFGANRGLVDPMYITGEEVSGGLFYAIDPATQQMWEVNSFGTGSWENAAVVDSGNTTHVAVLLQSDSGTSPGDYLRLYVGQKGTDANGDGSVDFLERNGLRGGSIYYFDPDGAASTTDLPDGVVTGTWSSSNAQALRETKLEDIHTNPLDGTQVVFSDQTDGLYRMDLGLAFSGGALDTANSTATIFQIDDDDSLTVNDPTNSLVAVDNLTWSANGKIYVQEDGTNGVDSSGNEMYELSSNGSGLLRIAQGLSEPSGIIDISGLVGYQTGSVFLVSILSTSNPSQLSVLISPNAMLIPEPSSACLTLIACLLLGWRNRRRIANAKYSTFAR